jgi:hypothetical protein
VADLTSLLSIGQIDDSELAQVLSERFSSAEHRDDELIFYLAGSDWAVKLVYDDDKLVRAESGPSFQREDGEYLRERIANELLGHRARLGADCYRFCYSFSGQHRTLGGGKRAPMLGK